MAFGTVATRNPGRLFASSTLWGSLRPERLRVEARSVWFGHDKRVTTKAMDRGELERLDRESLVVRAQAAGIRRARVLTRPELIDELLRLEVTSDDIQLRRARGFFGLARDLLSKVVERGLHLPDAADRLRVALGEPFPQVPRPEPQAVPTVTLAEIYAAQGHKRRAIETLERVLEAEPEHGAARALLERLKAMGYVPPPAVSLPPEEELGEARSEIGAHLGDPSANPAPSGTTELASRSSSKPPSHSELAGADSGVQVVEEAGGAPDSREEDWDGADTTTRFDAEDLDGADTTTRFDAEDLDRAETTTRFDAASLDKMRSTMHLDAASLDKMRSTMHLDAAELDEPRPTTHLDAAPSDRGASLDTLDPSAAASARSECVAIPIAGALYVWWKLSPAALAALDHASFRVRAVVLVPVWGKPECETRDVPCDPSEVGLWLNDLPPRAVVRVAIGCASEGAFVPLAHSPALEVSDVDRLVQWTPSGFSPVPLEDPRAASIATAKGAAQRALSHRATAR